METTKDIKAAQQKKPKILFAVFQTENRANGGVTSITEIIKRVSGERHVVTQMCTDINEEWRSAGAQVSVINLPYSFGASFRQQSAWGKLRWIVSIVTSNIAVFLKLIVGSFDVVHCNDPAPFWHVVPAAKVARVSVVFNLRDTKSENETAIRKRYRRRFAMVDVVLVLSREMCEFYEHVVGKEWLAKQSVELTYIYSIVNPPQSTEPELQPAARLPESAARGPLIQSSGTHGANAEIPVGVVAAFCDKKNQLDFIRNTCPILREKQPRIHIYFIGDFRPDCDPYAGACLQATNELHLNSMISFVGYQSDVWSWYRRLDLVVVPTRKEGLARCMIESISVGTPVISFDVCSAKEILEQYQCGAVVRQGDYTGIAEAISSVVDDAERRTQMSERGKLISKTLFDQQGIIDQYSQLYARIK